MSGYVYQLPTPQQYALMTKQQRAQAVKLYELNNRIYKQEMKVRRMALARAVRQEKLEQRKLEAEEQCEREAQRMWAERHLQRGGRTLEAVERTEILNREVAAHSMAKRKRKAGGTVHS